MAKAPLRTYSKVFSTVLAGGVILAFGLGLASAQELEWTDAMKAAQRAFEESRYADAERLLRTAVKEAEKFGQEDRRLATSLSSLGTVLYSQGKYAESQRLYLQAVAILEKTLGPGHLRVADSLTGFAGIYNMQG